MDKYNNPDAFDPDKVEMYEDLIDLRSRLRKAMRMLDSPNPKRGKGFWAVEVQEIQTEITTLEQEIKPVLVKG